MPVAAFIVTCDALDSGTTHACNLLGQSCQHVFKFLLSFYFEHPVHFSSPLWLVGSFINIL